MAKIDWTKWNKIQANLGQTLCRGEENQLTDAEIETVNEFLEDMRAASESVKEIFALAKDRFSRS